MKAVYLLLALLLFSACREEVASYRIYGASGNPYEIVLFDDYTHKFKPADESTNWVRGSWSGGLEEGDTFSMVLDVGGLRLRRIFVSESDSLRAIGSEIVE